MRFYELSEAGKIVSGRTGNPISPAFVILAKLRLLHIANTEKLMEVTGYDLGTTQLALAQLLSAKPPLIIVTGG